MKHGAKKGTKINEQSIKKAMKKRSEKVNAPTGKTGGPWGPVRQPKVNKIKINKRKINKRKTIFMSLKYLRR